DGHYSDMIVQEAAAGQEIEVVVETYAGHFNPGCGPYDHHGTDDFHHKFQGVTVHKKNDRVADFYFDLRVLLELIEKLPDTSFRKAEIIQVMLKLHEILPYSVEQVDFDTLQEVLKQGRVLMADALSKHNGPSVPTVGIIGHSHMDTAWLWHVDETIKRCARTYSNQMSLMDQYPEYRFVQSSAYHGDMMRQHYPELFETMKTRVAEGRYEPNGGVWVECDCNITSGESMIRQFLWGQRFTREHFNYTSDAFWLPDTFGYSAAIPQIMKGCGVDYFLTTKISWNDTNQFPYDTFWWKGIDGSKVLAHFNKTHVWPSPKDTYDLVYNEKNNDAIKQKHVTDQKLVSYGFGDGGGGPLFEMIEVAKRCEDLDGCPKMAYTSVSDFMQNLEHTVENAATYSGELYLELHRGTLTNQHEIKRNNRLAEIALHNLEYINVQNAIANQEVASDEAYRMHQNTTLVNQFHDILPGTCVSRPHEECRAQMTEVVEETQALLQNTVKGLGEATEGHLTLINTTSFEKDEVIYLDYQEGLIVAGDYKQQVVEDLKGNKKLAVAGIVIPPYGSKVITLVAGEAVEPSIFVQEGDTLETPFATITFNEKGAMESFIDKRTHRELRGEGYALNTLLFGEDVPVYWDNWDVDADMQLKLKDCATLIQREVIAQGAVEYRIRSKYQLTDNSFVKQDMIFYADSPLVKFETEMDWQEAHRFMKAAFDTTLFTDIVRQEVQFGHLKRSTTKNTSIEQAQFETVNHKYTDLSEANYGVAILNDSKYGISVFEGQLRLSLHKGGIHPDHKGDKGRHYCEYGFLPHVGGFNVETTIKPAYAFNYKPVIVPTRCEMPSLITSSAPSIIIETIKACEDKEKAFIVRVYESEGGYTNTQIQLGFMPKVVAETNMLEETQKVMESAQIFNVTLKPFEIKTFKINY
ncbi:MAG: alpha-mannosidase, partial [Cellulosilyticaceae bacterium]